jgi:mannosylglycerate hydrolase
MVANRGLAEYELLRDGRGTLALTLLRAVGWLSREDLLSRVGGAGPTIPTPEAQALGPQRASYAIIPHAGDWLVSGAYRTAEEYLAPLYGSTPAGGALAGDLPLSAGLVELIGSHTLLLSACKVSERGDALVLRFWNVAPETTEARLRLGFEAAEVRPVNLAEEPVSEEVIPVDEDGSVRLRVGPATIATLAITPSARFPIFQAPSRQHTFPTGEVQDDE